MGIAINPEMIKRMLEMRSGLLGPQAGNIPPVNMGQMPGFGGGQMQAPGPYGLLAQQLAGMQQQGMVGPGQSMQVQPGLFGAPGNRFGNAFGLQGMLGRMTRPTDPTPRGSY
jgi:hypothetical protein